MGRITGVGAAVGIQGVRLLRRSVRCRRRASPRTDWYEVPLAGRRRAASSGRRPSGARPARRWPVPTGGPRAGVLGPTAPTPRSVGFLARRRMSIAAQSVGQGGRRRLEDPSRRASRSCCSICQDLGGVPEPAGAVVLRAGHGGPCAGFPGRHRAGAREAPDASAVPRRKGSLAVLTGEVINGRDLGYDTVRGVSK